jgi:hypothetical protein
MEKLEAWIPFLQSLVWPLFIAAILIWARRWFKETLEIIKQRIKEGSEVRVGRDGIVVGTAPKLEPVADAGFSARVEAEIKKGEPVENKIPSDLKQSVYLIHNAKPYREMKNRPYYSISVHLDSDSPTILDRVSRVVYHLHPTFPDPAREITSRSNNFELSTLAWGQFNLRADIYFEGRERPLTLFRYLNF